MPVVLALLLALPYCHRILQSKEVSNLYGACRHLRHHCWCGGPGTYMQILTNSLPGSHADAAALTFEYGLLSLKGTALCNDEAPGIVRHDHETLPRCSCQIALQTQALHVPGSFVSVSQVAKLSGSGLNLS